MSVLCIFRARCRYKLVCCETVLPPLTWTYGGCWVQLQLSESESGAEVFVSMVAEARRCFVSWARSAGTGDVSRSKYVPFNLSLTFHNLLVSLYRGPGPHLQPTWGPLLTLADTNTLCQHFTLFVSSRMWPGYTLNPSWAGGVKACKWGNNVCGCGETWGWVRGNEATVTWWRRDEHRSRRRTKLKPVRWKLRPRG